MSRIFNQKNVWGSQGQINPQRSDLWLVDFTQVIRGINTQIEKKEIVTSIQPLEPTVEPYYVSSVSMPVMRVKADEFRRDSKPYMMPGFDEALPEIRIVFVMEAPKTGNTSKVYRFLEVWRAFVRAGRGAMGNELTVGLGVRYTAPARFPVTITLLRGNANPKISAVSIDMSGVNQALAAVDAALRPMRLSQIAAEGGLVNKLDFALVENDLEDCAVFQVENMWLAGYKLSDLDYSKGNELVKIEATFFADNIRDLSQKQQTVKSVTVQLEP